MVNRLNTIDGETLMGRPLNPPNFIIDGLLSQGLHILAGSPKVGKSWLALWLAVTVAKGEGVWGMSVQQGTTEPQRKSRHHRWLSSLIDMILEQVNKPGKSAENIGRRIGV